MLEFLAATACIPMPTTYTTQTPIHKGPWAKVPKSLIRTVCIALVHAGVNKDHPIPEWVYEEYRQIGAYLQIVRTQHATGRSMRIDWNDSERCRRRVYRGGPSILRTQAVIRYGITVVGWDPRHFVLHDGLARDQGGMEALSALLVTHIWAKCVHTIGPTLCLEPADVGDLIDIRLRRVRHDPRDVCRLRSKCGRKHWWPRHMPSYPLHGLVG